jgi:hypothetical protein
MIKTLFRPFNNEIPSDFWGNSKTHILLSKPN